MVHNQHLRTGSGVKFNSPLIDDFMLSDFKILSLETRD